ncbi:hypothetical protein BGX28_003258 [Mortierella sp. GBA30]|nr:hypothetical protein BGX28_003258 [Mortierella sp. GBA30]
MHSQGDSNLRRRNANMDNGNSPDTTSAASAVTTGTNASPNPSSSPGASPSDLGPNPAPNPAANSAANPASNTAATEETNSSLNRKVYYNGQTYEGTGRLPRDAPFTPTYVNAFTVNSAIAFVSLVVTATFFYFKIIVGILESPQIGPDREFYVQMSAMGPADAGEPRPMWTPICPSVPDERNVAQDPSKDQQSWSSSRSNTRGSGTTQEDDCAMFGKIVVLADSISKYGYTHATHGWLGFLADEWAGRADVVLRSFPEYNTHWVNALLPDLLYQESSKVPSEPLNLVIIALGTDDASFPNTRQHVAVDAYKDNLKSIIQSIRFPDSPNFSPHTQLILVTPAPVEDVMWETSLKAINQTMDRSSNVTKEYAQACAEVGQDLNIPVVDLWSDIQCQVDGSCELHESNQLQDYFMDGLHLRRMGNEVLYKGIMNAVARHSPQLHPTCWPAVFPGYAEGSSPDQSVLKRRCSVRHY